MPNWQAEADKAARAEGVPTGIFRALINRESGWRPHVRSPVGAIGFTQLMPDTARGLGVNPNDPLQNLQGGAKYLGSLIRRFGNLRLALAAYNAGPNAVAHYGGIPPYAETQNYVRAILQNAKGAELMATQPGEGMPAVKQLSGEIQPPQGPAPADVLQAAAPTDASTSILQRLGGTAGAVAQAAQAPIPLPIAMSQPQQAGTIHSTLPSAPQAGDPNMLGHIHISPGADRPGVKTGKAVLEFARRVASIFGHPLTIGTGTNHSRLTVNGNVSDHWSGHAVDIPAVGKTLIHMGQAALIAAGMRPDLAKKQKGGLFNVNGHQIIFNTHEGGDHTNHLHISAH